MTDDPREKLERLIKAADTAYSAARFLPAAVGYEAALAVLSRPPFTQISDLDSLRATLAFNCGTALLETGRLAAAEASYARAQALYDGDSLRERTDLDANRANLAANLGTALVEMGRLVEGEAFYARAQALCDGDSLRGRSELDDIRASLAMNRGNALAQMGRLSEAEAAYRRAQAPYDGEGLKDRRELDADRALLAMNRGTALLDMGRLAEAKASYTTAQALYDGEGLRGRTELDRARASLGMNLGNCLKAMGRLGVAEASYARARALLDSESLRTRTELDDTRSKLAMNRGNALRDMGRVVEAEASYARAQALYDGDSLRGRSELDADRARLAMNRGACLDQMGRLAEAETSYARARALYDGESLRGRTELDAGRAGLAMNRGNVLAQMGRLAEAEASYARAQALFDGESLRGRTELDDTRLKLLDNWARLLAHRSDAASWVRAASRRAVELVRDLPPDAGQPWTTMRQAFALLHRGWLDWCLADPDHYEMIPEVLAAVQGRELAASVAEQLAAAQGLEPEGPLARFIAARAELREMLAEMHRLAGSGGSGGSDGTPFRAASPEGPSAWQRQQLEDLGARYETRRREVQALREAAAREPGYAALGAAQTAIRLETLQGVLGDDEQLMVLFPHGEGAHALLIGRNGAPFHLTVPELPGLMRQARRLEAGLGRGGALRDNLDAARREAGGEPIEADAPLGGAAPVTSWAQLAETQRRILWAPLENRLIPGGTLLVVSAGDLHNLSLEPGRSERIGLMTRLPGLAFFALSRGLYGGTPARATPGAADRVAILADEAARDIPLVAAEGRHAAGFWREAGAEPDYPSGWPDRASGALSFLHVAGHGGLQSGVAGSRHSVIVQGDGRIGEREILGAMPAIEALINICVAGRIHDDLNGDPAGVVAGFLRHGTHWVVASLVALPDVWAFLAGLILTDLRSGSAAPLPALLEETRRQLEAGGWSDRVSTAFTAALIEVSHMPHYQRTDAGDLVAGPSPREELAAILSPARAAQPKPTLLRRAGERLEAHAERAREGSLWWLASDPTLIDRLFATPEDLDALIDAAIPDAVAQARRNGPPTSIALGSVRNGLTLFGDPKTATGM